MKVAKRTNVEFEEFKKYVGLETFSVLCVNPTRKELNALYGKEDSDEDQEIEYVDEKDDEDRIRVTLYLKAHQTDRITKVSFLLVDKQRVNKEGDKCQFINQTCTSTWCDDEANLPEWFTHFQDKNKNNIAEKSYRRAIEGESDFYDFVRGITRGIDYYSTDTEVHFNFKKMLKGDFSQLNEYLKEGDYSYPFVGLNYIKPDLENGKEYNEVYSKAVLPAMFFDKVRYLQEDSYKMMIDDLKDDERFKDFPALNAYDIMGYVEEPKVIFKKSWEMNSWEKFITNVTNDYGCKGFYKLCPVFEYKKDMNPVSNDEPLTDSDY